ncbi:MAG TPA: carboxypeptidase-like regulatory domain-containing protein, partial [Vicinamibacterales bacterium]|nr:carboxypeptidase-like regulatory domain-containing protein [Vicinamibacterales bacterium]
MPVTGGRTALLLLIVALLLAPVGPALADEQGQGVVVDQTGLPLPGATVQLLRGTEVVTSITTAGDGTFAIDPALKGDTLVVSLDGFETARVERSASAKIVLSIGRAAETTTVIAMAPTLTPASPTTSLLGSSITAATVSRLPSSRLKARESLPLLPSVVRGPDGLMQLGGARAHETPVLLDGFNVTDPATG